MKKTLFTRLLAACLSVVLVFTLSLSSVFAAEANKTYKYVALGDSVVAGNGLDSSYDLYMHGLFMKDVSQYNVKGSYPDVFGGLLTDYIQGQDSSYDVTVTNCGQCGYSSTNLLNALNGDTAMTDYQQFTIGRYFPSMEYVQSLFDYNDEILNTQIADADLISVGSGLNDISESVVDPLLEAQDNPLMTVFRMAFLAKVNGADIPYETLINLLTESDISVDQVSEFLQYVISIPSLMTQSCMENIQNTQKIVTYLEENSDAQIALVSSYNPFGNSLTCDGVTYDAVTIATEIVKAIVEVYQPDLDVDVDTDVVIEGAEGEETASAQTTYAQLGTQMTELLTMLSQPQNLIDTDKLSELVTNISERLSYVISFGTIGLISTPFFMLINAGLQQIAAKDSNVTYVNIYGIPNENNSNPHPDVDGHKYIANQMAKKLFSNIELD